MDKTPTPKRNKRLMKGASHVGGTMIERSTSILDGEKLDKHGLSLRDYE